MVNAQNSCFLSTEDPNKIRNRTQEETKKLLKEFSKQEATFYFQLTGPAKINFKRAKEFVLTGLRGGQGVLLFFLYPILGCGLDDVENILEDLNDPNQHANRLCMMSIINQSRMSQSKAKQTGCEKKCLS